MNSVALHVFKKNFKNVGVVIVYASVNSGFVTICLKNRQTRSRITEHKSIVYSHGILNVITKRFAIKNPKILPAFDFDDQIPTNFPSFRTLKLWLKIVNVAGKKLNWKNPNTPNEAAIKMWSSAEPVYSNCVYLNRDIIGMILNPITVGMAVNRQASTGLWLFKIE